MYTDIHFLAYLQKRMTAAEAADFERAVQENAELKAYLEMMTLAYLLHEHPDSAYSTTTLVSDDTRSFVKNLFDETVYAPPTNNDFVSSKLLIVATCALAFIIAAFWYFSNPKNTEPAVKRGLMDTIDSIKDTNTVKQNISQTTKEEETILNRKSETNVFEPQKDTAEAAFNTAFFKAKKLENSIKTAQQAYSYKKLCKEKCISNQAAAQSDPDSLVFEDLTTVVSTKIDFEAKANAINKWLRVSNSRLDELRQNTDRLNAVLLKKQCKCD